MLPFTVENLIKACQNNDISYAIYQITAYGCAYDPEEDTELIIKTDRLMEIPESFRETEVADFYVDGFTLTIWIN